MSRQTRATTVVIRARRFWTSDVSASASAEPDLLNGVLGFALRAEYPDKPRPANVSRVGGGSAQPGRFLRPSVTFFRSDPSYV